MLQTTQNTIMFPNVPVDRGISFANLGIVDYADKAYPRNKSDVYASIPIPVGNISAIRAFEDNRCCLMKTSTSTADLACISGWNSYNSSIVLPRYLLECNSKLMVGHSFDFSVGFSMQPAFVQTFQVFNSNVSVIFFSKIHNFMCDFTTSGFNKVRFITFHFFKFLSSFNVSFFSQFLENSSSDGYVSLSIPDISSKVQLSENFAIFVDNAQCNKCSASTVYADNGIISFFDDKLLFDVDQYSPARAIPFKLKCSKNPSVFKKMFKAIPDTILSYWKSNSLVKRSNDSNRILPFGIFQISRPRNVVRDARSFNTGGLGFMPYCKNIFEQVYNHLRLQTCILFNMAIFKSVKVVSCLRSIRCNSIPIPQCFKTMIRTFKPFLFKFCKRCILGIGQRKYIQRDGLCYLHIQQYKLWVYLIYKRLEIKCQNAKLTFIQPLPRINSWVSLEDKS